MVIAAQAEQPVDAEEVATTELKVEEDEDVWSERR